MRTWSKVLGYYFSLAMAYIVSVIPLSIRWRMGSFIGYLAFNVFKFRRYTLLKNLTIAFPESSPEWKYQIARKSIDYLGYSLLEFWQLPLMKSEKVKREVVVEGWSYYEEALKKNKGILFLSCHIGNGDVGIAVMTLLGMKAHLISKKFKVGFLNDFWFGVREGLGCRFIDPHGSKTAFEILSACRRNEGVIFVIDQFMSVPYGIETKFFGRKTGTAYGLALFHMKTGAPVLPVYTYRDQNLRTRLAIGPEIETHMELATKTDRDQRIAELTQNYNDVLEQLVRRHADQWMWVHRRWKKWG